MKTMTKLATLCAVGLGVAVGLAGCAEDNEKEMKKGVAGAPAAKEGVTPPDAPKSSKEAYEKFSGKNSLMEKNAKTYRQQ